MSDQPKEILFVYYKLFKAGGVARVLVSLANELVKQGHGVTILVLINNTESFYELDKRIKIVAVDTFSHWGFKKINVNLDKYFPKLPYKNNIKNYVYDFGQWEMLNKWINKNHQNYDVIISSWYKLSAQLALNKNVNRKTIAWEHISFDVGGVLWNKILRKYYKNLKSVVSINHPGEKYYKNINSNVFVIPNMMSDDIENVEINYNHKQNTILVPSRLDPEKNLVEFLEIIKSIDLKNDWKVKIFGDGKDEEILKNIIIINKLSNVYLNRALTQSEILEELKKSKIICMTSFKEGLPTILIEGLFTSNALVSYDCNYGPSDIVNEKNGFLIPMHDKQLFKEKLQYLIDNTQELENLCKSSYEQSKKWKKEKILNQWITILK